MASTARRSAPLRAVGLDHLQHLQPTCGVLADRTTLGDSTGAFVLAAAGLLEGRPVTTHWREADRLARLFPGVKIDPDVLFIDDGDVLTCAGVAAGIDLCLHIVRRDHGSAVANQVARACVVPPMRDGGQAQYIQRLIPVRSAEFERL